MSSTAFVEEIERRYRGGRERLFILHGNITDLFPFKDGAREQLLMLPDYLYHRLRGRVPAEFDPRIWMHFSLDSGIRWLNESDGINRIPKVSGLNGVEAAARMKHMRQPFDFLRTVVRASVADEEYSVPGEGQSRKRKLPLRIVATDAHLIMPEMQAGFMSPEDRDLLVLLKRFAGDPTYDPTDSMIVLTTDALSGIHRELREVAVTIEVPRPSEHEMGAYIEEMSRRPTFSFPADQVRPVREVAVGLTLRQVTNVVDELRAAGSPITAKDVAKRREELIGRDFGDFLEFFKPTWTLDQVGGSVEAVAELRSMAELLSSGDRDIPSGIILVGQNGIGKTFLAKALLGTAGITGVLLKPFQDSLLGASERNWEKIAGALRSAGRIGILVDEADAQMGQRSGQNVHEVSKRIFAMQMQLMGDPNYRGKIFWILMTCRPDKLAPDVKRPGRCERIIPLFPVTSVGDAHTMLSVQVDLLSRKDGYVFAGGFLDVLRVAEERFFRACIGKTGAQIEQVLRRAKKRAKRDAITLDHVAAVLHDEGTIKVEPAAYELQRLLGIVAAVESENTDLIPRVYQSQIFGTFNGIDGVKRRVEALRASIDH